MSKFPTAAHLASWAGLAPAMYESAGRRSPVGRRRGNKWLTGMLVEAALPRPRPAWLVKRNEEARTHRHVSQLEKLGRPEIRCGAAPRGCSYGPAG